MAKGHLATLPREDAWPSQGGTPPAPEMATRLLGVKRKFTEKEELVLRLQDQYTDDAGVIAAFLLNYVKRYVLGQLQIMLFLLGLPFDANL
ncbi:hypothetical protein Dsin_005928 [Dipteronia sinensis]|uniref:Uncharacterized protein n=1 Tax=Dipteronia sinensis TaxID=43782 RepID=A0AAE0AXI7_9ROSI|nr:hypothetical protein Dsin_005928 [Dipteronia sinensis]